MRNSLQISEKSEKHMKSASENISQRVEQEQTKSALGHMQWPFYKWAIWLGETVVFYSYPLTLTCQLNEPINQIGKVDIQHTRLEFLFNCNEFYLLLSDYSGVRNLCPNSNQLSQPQQF